MSAPTQPDLAALREKAEQIRAACPCCNPFGDEDGNDAAADQILAVLALVDRLQADNERLREALTTAATDLGIVHHMFDGGPVVRGILDTLEGALVGSPAEKEQP